MLVDWPLKGGNGHEPRKQMRTGYAWDEEWWQVVVEHGATHVPSEIH